MTGKLIPIYDLWDTILQKCGSFQALQKFRLAKADYYEKHPPKEDLAGEIYTINLVLDELLREEAQKEENNKKNYEALKVEEAKDEKQLKELESLRKKLEERPSTFCFADRVVYEYESRLPKSIRKAYDTCRTNPKWYLHPDLVKECVDLGGCCGRACQCCAKRELTHGRRHGVGHCTLYCGCCAETRGAELTNEDMLEIEKMVGEEFEGSDLLITKMRRAFFTGIGSG